MSTIEQEAYWRPELKRSADQRMSESRELPPPTPERPDSADVPEEREVSRKFNNEANSIKDIRRTNKRVQASNKEQKPKSIF